MSRRRGNGGTAGAGIASLAFALACLLSLACAPAIAAGRAATKVEVGTVRLAVPVHGRGALLVPVRYPIQLAGHPLALSASLNGQRVGKIGIWMVSRRANAGSRGLPERRRGFTFVHRIDLSREQTRLVRRGGVTVRVAASGALDVNRDGFPELEPSDRDTQRLSRADTGRALCSTVPELRAKPGGGVATRLPACGRKLRWRIDGRPEHGIARIRNGRLTYRPAAKFRGTDSIGLTATAAGGAGATAISAPIQIKVTAEEGAVVRAIGDSVTAGFGYYDDGSSMPFTSLLSCKPAETNYNDACSSNSTNRSNKGTSVNYAPDYGLANNVSWAAQWANAHGVTNYENLAISGSEPHDWAPEGRLYSTTKRVEAEDPDYVLMTVGANPLLSEMLFGVDNMGCAIWSNIFGGFSECIEEAFEGAHLRTNLKNFYRELVAKTDATIYLMGYPVTVPSSALAYSATQLAMTGRLLNREIEAVAAEVSSTRLQPIDPPHFNVGIDISPVYPSTYSCSRLGYEVDGQSVQSEPTQDELLLSHPLSFCSGPAEGPPWVISGDSGIHPSAAGYAQMAAQIPAPG
jgi:lysophospholipase L1-like esterase